MLAHVLEGADIRTTNSVAEVAAAHAQKRTLWVDLEERTPETEALLADTFKLHPLVIEDIWGDRSLPKIEDFDAYLYLIVHGVKQGSGRRIELLELDLVLGQTFVITYQHESRGAHACREDLARSPKLLKKGAVWLAHALLDHLVDHYLPLVDAFDGELVIIEREIPDKAGLPEGRALLHRLFGLRRVVHEIRQVAVHQRELLLRLSRGEFDEIPPEAVPFFRDVYDHFARFTAVVDGYREMLSSTVEAYLSVQSNRMNEVMKTLTLISTVMLPITFIAGVYGMNFEHMPELRWPYGYAFALGLMVLVTAASVVFFKRRRWL
jgi:magnesium transporter